MKACASARTNLSAIRSASQLSTSKAASSSRRWLALGMADSSWTGMAMRSSVAFAVSVTAASVAQPAPMSPRSTSASKTDPSIVTTLASRRSEAEECSVVCTVSATRGAARKPPSLATDRAFSSRARPRSPSSSPERR